MNRSKCSAPAATTAGCPTRNWDTLIYLFAREHLRDVERVKFYIPDSYAIGFEFVYTA